MLGLILSFCNPCEGHCGGQCSSRRKKKLRKKQQQQGNCKAAMICAFAKNNLYFIYSRVPFVFVCLNHLKVTLCQAEGKTKKSSMEINAAKPPVRTGGAAVIFKWQRRQELFPLDSLCEAPPPHTHAIQGARCAFSAKIKLLSAISFTFITLFSHISSIRRFNLRQKKKNKKKGKPAAF